MNNNDDQKNEHGEASDQLSRHELTTRLYLANLSTRITEQDLRDLFVPYYVKHVAFLEYHATARSTGYGIVDVADSHEAERAVQELDGEVILDYPISVGLTSARPDARPRIVVSSLDVVSGWSRMMHIANHESC